MPGHNQGEELSRQAAGLLFEKFADKRDPIGDSQALASQIRKAPDPQFKKEPAALELARKLQAKDRQYLIVYFDEVKGDEVKGDIYSNIKQPAALASLLAARSNVDKPINQVLNAIAIYVNQTRNAILHYANNKINNAKTYRTRTSKKRK